MFAASEADVVNAVQCSQKNSVPVCARTSGHSYEGFSLCSGVSHVFDALGPT